MLDFTSALYLGLRHPSAGLLPWESLTAGRPAVLGEPSNACETAAALAALQGCEASTLLPSTLHLFWDLFGVLGGAGAAIYIEAATYAVACWGVQRGASLGTPVHSFPRGDVAALARLIARTAAPQRRPLIVCDGLQPGCDRLPPLARYAAIAARHDGYLVLDDTQALGVLGHGAGPDQPLGCGGGGSLRRQDLAGAQIIVGASLAKAFGAPIAALSGSRALVRLFTSRSQTRVHMSPPSVAVIHAARQALALNRRCGDGLRRQLWQRIRQFRERLARLSLRSTGGAFPVQSLAPVRGIGAAALHAGLLQRQVRTVLLQGGPVDGGRLGFILTAAHTADCIDRAVDALEQTLRAMNRRVDLPSHSLETP